MSAAFLTYNNIKLWPISGFCAPVSFFLSEIETLQARDIFRILVYQFHLLIPRVTVKTIVQIHVHNLKKQNKQQQHILMVLFSHSVCYWERIHLRPVDITSGTSCVTLLQLHVCCLVKENSKNLVPPVQIYCQGSTLREMLSGAFVWILSTRSLWRISFAVSINGCWQVALLLVNSSEVSQVSGAAFKIPPASGKWRCTLSEPSLRETYTVAGSGNIRPRHPTHLHWRIFTKVCPPVTVIAESNLVRALDVAGLHPKHTNPHTYQSVCLSPVFAKP